MKYNILSYIIDAKYNIFNEKIPTNTNSIFQISIFILKKYITNSIIS